MKLDYIKEVQSLWLDISVSKKKINSKKEIDFHEKIKNTFQVGPFYYFVLDFQNFCFQYISPHVKEVLGYDSEGLEYAKLSAKIHPEDKINLLNSHNTLKIFLANLPIEKYKKYKVCYDFRIQNSSGEYVKIYGQLIILESNEKDFINVLVLHTDITSLKTDNNYTLSFIGLDGEPSYINYELNKIYKQEKELLSKREKDVLQCLINGMSSIEIAEKLNISKHTVETHRKNMHKKTESKNTPELIYKIEILGLL